MNDQEKTQRIKELQEKKEKLSPKVKEAFQAKSIAFKTYTGLNNKWMRLKDQFEEFDKEEKVLFFSIPKNKISTRTRMTRSNKERKMQNVLKIMKGLPESARKEILANFK